MTRCNLRQIDLVHRPTGFENFIKSDIMENEVMGNTDVDGQEQIDEVLAALKWIASVNVSIEWSRDWRHGLGALISHLIISIICKASVMDAYRYLLELESCCL